MVWPAPGGTAKVQLATAPRFSGVLILALVTLLHTSDTHLISFDDMCIPCLKTLKTRLKTRSGPRFALISGSIWSTWLNSVQVSPDVDIKSQATMPSQGILVFPSISQLLDAANQPWACNSIDIRDLSWQSQSKKHWTKLYKYNMNLQGKVEKQKRQ